jgi:3-dehydroquinate synthetase
MVGLPTNVSSIPGGVPGADRLMDLIAQDKKVKHGKLTFILARGIGASFIAPNVDSAEVRAFLAEKLAEPRVHEPKLHEPKLHEPKLHEPRLHEP